METTQPPAEVRTRLGADAVTWLTVCLVFLFGVPSRLVVGPLGSAGAPSMLLGLASLGAWLLYRIGAWNRVKRPVDPLGVALGVFLFTVGVSYAWAMSRVIISEEVSPADVAILSLLSWTGFLLIARDVLNRERLNTLVWRISVAAGIMALLGLAQFVTRKVLIDVITLPGLTATRAAFAYFRDSRIRPSGTAIHPLEYGAILTLLLPLTLHVAFHHKARPFVLRWAPAVLVGGVIAISSSRTAYLAAAVGVVVCLFGWSRQQRRTVLGMALVAFLGLGAVLPNMLVSILNLFTGLDEDPSISSRTDSFSLAWSFIERHAIFGRGLGTFLPKYRIFDNQYLLLLVSIGFIGTLAFVAFVLVALARIALVRRRSFDDDTNDLAISLTGCIVAGALSLAFFDTFSFPMTMGAFFLVIGVSGALGRQTLDGLEQP